MAKQPSFLYPYAKRLLDILISATALVVFAPVMAVVAVGDFDPAAIEALIVRHFSGLTNPPDAPPRPAAPVPDHAETFFSIATDPELSTTRIEIACKHPVESEGSAADYRRDLVNSLYETLLNDRLSERVHEANPPYLYAGVDKSRLVRVKAMAAPIRRIRASALASASRASTHLTPTGASISACASSRVRRS